MKKSTIYLKALVNVVLYIVAFILILIFVPKLLSFFLPFVIGWIISLIANPAVKFFEEKVKFKRKAGSAVFIVLIIALIILAGYGILYFIVSQAIDFVESVPEKWPSWQASLERLGGVITARANGLPTEFVDKLKNLGTTIENALSDFISGLGGTGTIGSSVISGLGSIASILIGIIMVVLSAYFFTAEHNNLNKAMEKYLPDSIYTKLMAAFRGLKNAVGGYFVAQFKIEIWVYLITIVGLLICRIEFAAVIALAIAILDFLPFFGAGAIMVPWGIICIVNAQYFAGIGILITWAVGQLIRQLIQPKIMGAQVGLAPLPTLVILFIGYKFSSVIGMIVAIPIAMIFIEMVKEGVFSTFITSIKILWKGLTDFRHLKPDELSEVLDSKDNEED